MLITAWKTGGIGGNGANWVTQNIRGFSTPCLFCKKDFLSHQVAASVAVLLWITIYFCYAELSLYKSGNIS